MTDSTREWLKKAQGDYRTMLREYRATPNPNYDAVCFHAQQCVEKLLKGFLNQHGIRFAKTHDLLQIIRFTYPLQPGWKLLEIDADSLTEHAVDSRYPGEDRTMEEARYAIKVCKRIRKAVREVFKNPDQLSL